LPHKTNASTTAGGALSLEYVSHNQAPELTKFVGTTGRFGAHDLRSTSTTHCLRHTILIQRCAPRRSQRIFYDGRSFHHRRFPKESGARLTHATLPR
jgi:hypothetical protein